MERDPDVMGQSISSDVVGLNQRSVKKIAEGDAVAGLETNEIFARAGKRFGRNGSKLVQVAAPLFRPIKHNHGGGDFGQAADLAFVFLVLCLQNVTGLRIDDDVGAGSVERAACRKTERQRKKNEEKIARRYHR